MCYHSCSDTEERQMGTVMQMFELCYEKALLDNGQDVIWEAACFSTVSVIQP